MGMNLISSCILAPYFLFQPTPPYGDECDIIEFNKTIFTISTHTPHGDEPESTEAAVECMQLQPAPPYGDERRNVKVLIHNNGISTHTPV